MATDALDCLLRELALRVTIYRCFFCHKPLVIAGFSPGAIRCDHCGSWVAIKREPPIIRLHKAR